MNDIVYILKNDYDSDELRYSLRSVCENFPYRKIWFYGGKPKGIEPDVMVEYLQPGNTKWEKVSNTLKEICKNDNITPDFWLFNDDFFIMQRVEDLPAMVGGTLWFRANEIKEKYGSRDSRYSKQLRETATILRDAGFDRLNYALHVPMLINREKGLKTILRFWPCPMFRSLYGNHHRIGGVIADDVKIHDINVEPTGSEVLLSTGDGAFAEGLVGKYIRVAFPEKCKYETL